MAIPVPTSSYISPLSIGYPKVTNNVSCRKPTIFIRPPVISLEVPVDFVAFNYLLPINQINDELSVLEFEYNDKLLSIDNGNTDQLLYQLHNDLTIKVLAI